MGLALTILALIGLFIFAIAAVVWLAMTPRREVSAVGMVLGGLVWAVATIVHTFISIT